MTAGPTESDRFRLRPCEASDREAVYEVCLKTGDGGEDATDLYTDPKALGHIYVGPYMRLEPLLAFVLEDEIGVCGYVLGALESERFYRRYAEEWLPSIRAAIRIPTGAPEGWSQTERIYHQLLEPRPHYPKKLRGYPSHLHIDLLPRAQGRGWGARMMGRLMNELAALGSSGAHLAMDSRNERARRFYTKLGFAEIDRVEAPELTTVYFGKKLEKQS